MSASQWQKGTSGNLRGRPPGSGVVQRLRASIEQDIPAVLESVVNAAKSGDITAAKLLLDRVFPALKPVELPKLIDMPGSGVSSKAQAILAQAAAGEVSALEAAQLIGALANIAKLIELDDLIQRVSRLEQVT